MAHALAFACFTSSLSARESSFDVQLRIHAPFSDLYAGEKDNWLVRVENHGKETIPMPDGRPSLKEEQPPPQFHVQTEAEASAGKNPQAASWDTIQSFGNGMKEMDYYRKLVPEPVRIPPTLEAVAAAIGNA